MCRFLLPNGNQSLSPSPYRYWAPCNPTCLRSRARVSAKWKNENFNLTFLLVDHHFQLAANSIRRYPPMKTIAQRTQKRSLASSYVLNGPKQCASKNIRRQIIAFYKLNESTSVMVCVCGAVLRIFRRILARPLRRCARYAGISQPFYTFGCIHNLFTHWFYQWKVDSVWTVDAQTFELIYTSQFQMWTGFWPNYR